MTKILIIFGDKTADEILPIAQDQYSDLFDEIFKQYFDQNTVQDAAFKQTIQQHDEVHFIIGVVDTGVRMQIQKFALGSGFKPFTVIHKSADVAESATIGAGCFIAPQAVVSVNAVIGDFSIVHIHASVGHDARLGKDCTILPGARISGEVTMGDGVLVGSNSFVLQKVKIGARSQIDAMTYVRHDVEEGMLVSCHLERPVKRVGS